jgi:MFS family permease
VANVVSAIGNHLTMIALPLYVFSTTGSTARTGLVVVFQMVPFILASFVGGGFVDRIGAKRISILSDMTSGLTIAAIPALDALGELELWHILALAALGALLDGPGMTARYAMLPDLIGRSGLNADRVNATVIGAGGFARVGGPILGGVLFAAIGAENVLWIDGATFVVSSLLISFFLPAVSRTSGAKRRTIFADLAAGIGYLWRHPLLIRFTLAIIGCNLTAIPLAAVVIPKLSLDSYDSARVGGLLLGSDGAGMIVGTTLFGMLATRLTRHRLWQLSFTLLIVPFLMLAPIPPMILAMLGMFCLGLGFGLLQTLSLGLFQERTAEEMRGRVFGLREAMMSASAPVAVIVVGLALEEVSVSAVLVVLAVVNVAVLVWFALDPTSRHLEASAAEGTELEAEPRTA